ncbi:unnamed protein product (macronuclear) [Paramecium tetraurelia]|uniref:Protein kinase domain-containing protein n=1 Tax=Paramecium tetraurelia TaxID=5888 RepID=A0CG15_PARTE|nr:uncharacterized protein GSPATT00038175001 [Paramecium tetraurelia]CAK69732.1 unnamed protein product [Paramecium tetraurelia]|eukprot:XP_001437129.1 hypothetical protein (macronuclear) [Paramecium tetraurelia strain d4-2]
MDYEQVMNDKKLREQLEGGETIVLTMKVIKFTGQNKKLPRVIAITNKNVYNISPAEGNSVKSFFQSLVNKSRIKRKIPLSAITSITISKIVKEFILHIPTEYDQRYQVDDQLSLIIQTLCEVYVKHNLKKIRCHFIEEMNLSQYTTTNYDIKKSVRRQLPKKGAEMTVDDVKIAMQAARGNVQTIYQKSNTSEISIEDFTLIKMLGRGAFGKVMLCEKKDTKEIFAIKSLRKEDIISRDHIEYLKTERKILEQTQHPFLVSLEYAFITQECVYFVMKFMIGGELYTHLQKVNKFNEDYALFYSSQVLLALEYLHKQGIIYRDLKPENILMDEKGYVALTDYGLAKFLSKGQVAQSIVGTPEYLAPEVITQQGHAFTADWWCLGILIFEMLCGRTPFFSENRNQMFRNIVESELKFPSTINLSNDCKNLLTALLKKKPHERLGNKGDAEEIKKHPWFKKIDFQRLLQKEIQAPIIPDLQSATDLSNFNPQILDEKIEEDQNQTTNTQAVKKFDQEFYGLNYKKE